MPITLSNDSKTLETFSGVLKCLGCDNFLSNINDIVHRLLDTSEVKQLLDNKNVEQVVINNFIQTLKSIKLMIKIYDDFCKRNERNTQLEVDEILQSIRDVLEVAVIESEFPEDFPFDLVLDIVNIVYDVVAHNPVDRNIQEVANFYQYNLYMIKVKYTLEAQGNHVVTKELSLRLRILSAVLGTLLKIENEPANSNFTSFFVTFKKYLKNNEVPDSIRESSLFSKIIIRNSENVAVLLTLCVLPKYIKVFQNTLILQTVWDEILSFSNDNTETTQHGRNFLVMCSLFDLFFNQLEHSKEETHLYSIFEDEKYWIFLQNGLTNLDSMVRKQALYLFKLSVEKIKERNSIISCQQIDELNVCNFDQKLNDGIVELKNGIKNFMITNNKIFLVHNDTKNIMWWDINLRDELYNIYKQIFLVLECLEEKQFHIIKPTFDIIENIIKFCKVPFYNGNVLHISWVIVILQRLITHDNLSIVKWGTTNLIKLSIDLFPSETGMTAFVQLLIKSLNNVNVYLNESENFRKDLQSFFTHSTTNKSSVIFFKILVNEMNRVTWSAEALFYMLDALANTPRGFFWTETELWILKDFVCTALRTHYTFIRCGIQCRLLIAIINLTDTSNINLDTIASLLGSFCTEESLQRGSKVWNDIVNWIEYCYSKKSAEDFILRFLKYDPNKVIDDKSIAKMIVLLHDAHLFGIMKCCGETPSCRIINAITTVLSPFKDYNKRLYSDRKVMDYYLSIFCYILNENLCMKNPEKTRLVEMMLRFLHDIATYIQLQLETIQNLGDFHVCQLYLRTYENILKVHQLYKIDSALLTSELFDKLVSNLKSDSSKFQSNPEETYSCSIQKYIQMKLMKIIIENVYNDNSIPHIRNLQNYFQKEINSSLQKTISESKLTMDLQKLWSKMNSEYLEMKWHLLERLKYENLVHVSNGSIEVKKFIASNELLDHCIQALEVGGYSVLIPVMSVLKDVLTELEDKNVSTIVRVADIAWILTFEVRKTEGFWLSIEKFIEMLFQGQIIHTNTDMHEILLKFSKRIFCEPISGLANMFLRHIQRLGVKYSLSPFFCHVLSSALLYGPLQRKDERLNAEVCQYIESMEICSLKNNGSSSNEVRARAIQIILTLDQTKKTHCIFAANLVNTLIIKEKEISNNKSRYFGDSYVHRVKNRLLQALMILEPLLPKENIEGLANWLYNNIIDENHQPSVRYQQEWLLVRILHKHPHLQNGFWNNFNEALEKRVGSLCSFISIVYHLSKIMPTESLSIWVERAIGQFLPYCMAQHFSVRLYAQVTLQKLWNLAKEKKLNDVIDKYQIVSICLIRSIENGNAVKNSSKLQEDFYFTLFDPIEHFSLQTIFLDLPRLSNLASDEWISNEIFSSCGVTNLKGRVQLETANDLLSKQSVSKWLLKTSQENFKENKGDNVKATNLQKKMIPMKSLVPDYDELLEFQEGLERKSRRNTGGLIVVASLIDKIPNLGGLGRTCEVFGVSEYVLASLKYVEDKQFQSLSVTAEKWLSITEIKPHYLTEYLTEMKQKGYSVLGAEQTVNSKALHEVQFPQKSILLLGNEKEGIPAELLPLLDICIEIPQLGIIRSLNVHVTGALFIWEYAKQHSLFT